MTEPERVRTIDDHFCDWQAEVFGYGYGTGEEPVLTSLAKFLALCRDGGGGRGYDYRQIEAELGAPVTWLLINVLCRARILEYGTSARFGWLTAEGESVREYLASRPIEDAIMMVCETEPECCTPEFCNCGPDGYSKVKLCHSPFWVERAQSRGRL